MPDILKIILIITGVLLIILVAFVLTMSFINKNKIKKMYSDVEDVIKHSIPENDEGYNIIRNNEKTYDYQFITPKCDYYIKVIPNFGNEEICINNPLKWQLRKSFNDDTMRFVPDVEPLLRLDIPSSGKAIKKLYLIYPNTKSLLKYINECEMIFVQPTTDVGGSNVVTYINLKEHIDLLEL